ERPVAVLDQSGAFGDLVAGGAEEGAGVVRFAGGEEDRITGVRSGGGDETALLLLRGVLGHGPGQGSVLAHEHIVQALGAGTLGPVLPAVELTTARKRGV